MIKKYFLRISAIGLVSFSFIGCERTKLEPQIQQNVNSYDKNNNLVEDSLEEMLKNKDYPKYYDEREETELVGVWIKYETAPGQAEKQGILDLGGLYAEPLSPTNLTIYAGLPREKLEDYKVYAKKFHAYIQAVPGRRCGND